MMEEHIVFEENNEWEDERWYRYLDLNEDNLTIMNALMDGIEIINNYANREEDVFSFDIRRVDVDTLMDDEENDEGYMEAHAYGEFDMVVVEKFMGIMSLSQSDEEKAESLWDLIYKMTLVNIID